MFLGSSEVTVAQLLVLVLGLLVQNLNLGLNLNSALNHSLYREAHGLHLKSLESKRLKHALAARRVQMHQAECVTSAELPKSRNVSF